jgi:outer membrane receptor protein involved in Fe transport
LRIQGEGADGKLNYVLGGYYSDESIDQSATFSLGQDYGENVGALLFAATNGALGPNPLTVFTGLDPAGTNNTNRFQQSAQSYSIFGNVSYELAEGLEFTLGARYAWEEKTGSFDQLAVNNQICPATLGALGAIPAPLRPSFIGLGCFGFTAPVDLPQAGALPLPRSFDADFSDQELIYTARLGYAFDDNVNAYASFTHGYKAGGINLDTTAAVGGADPAFLSEEVDAYEIGLKTRVLDDALTANIAAFYEEFTNFQVLEFTGTAFQTFNVPLARTTGLEIETLWKPHTDLTINAAATILDARYPEECAGTSTAVTVLSLCGNTLTNASDFVAIMGALWEKPINDTTEFFLAGQIRLEGDQRTSTQAIVPPTAAQITAAGGVQQAIDAAPLIIGDVQDGKEFINLRAGLRFNDGQFSLEGFVNNLTDNVVRGVTFNTTLRGSGAANSRSAYTLQPRTYGVTLRAKF